MIVRNILGFLKRNLQSSVKYFQELNYNKQFIISLQRIFIKLYINIVCIHTTSLHDIGKIEMIQHRAACFVLKSWRRTIPDSVSSMLADLHAVTITILMEKVCKTNMQIVKITYCLSHQLIFQYLATPLLQQDLITIKNFCIVDCYRFSFFSKAV